MKIVYSIFFMILVFASGIIAQEINKKDNAIDGGSGGSEKPIKKNIPNYIPNQKRDQRTRSSVIDSSLMISKFSGSGTSGGAIIDKPYGDDKRIDLRFGWITNSESEILKDTEGDVSLILDEKQSEIYIGYLLKSSENIIGFTISFDSKCDVDFVVLEISSLGIKHVPFSFKLEKGSWYDYQIKFIPVNYNSSLLIKFIKQNIGEFKLLEIKTVEG